MAECKVEEDSAKQQKSVAEAKNAECEYELAKVTPIYEAAVMEWMYRSATKLPYGANIEKLKENIVSATIQVYNDVQK